MTDYGRFQHLLFDYPEDGILQITINRPDRMNATDERLHWELSRVWTEVADDRKARAVVITGAGKAFSAGGDLEMIEGFGRDADKIAQVMREAADIVYNMINLEQPIVSAINGTAVGAGLVVALMADVSVANERARLTDGHTRLGVAAGDHSAIIWPLLCGMAKAKYYLLTCDFLDGREAERIGLVSLAVPPEEVLPRAMQAARTLAAGPQHAIRFTKRALNQWLRLAGPTFDYSLAAEMLGMFHDDLNEGVQALRDKREPQFPSTKR